MMNPIVPLLIPVVTNVNASPPSAELDIYQLSSIQVGASQPVPTNRLSRSDGWAPIMDPSPTCVARGKSGSILRLEARPQNFSMKNKPSSPPLTTYIHSSVEMRNSGGMRLGVPVSYCG